MSTVPFRSQFTWATVDGEASRQISYSIQANDTSLPIPQDKLLNIDACLVLEAGQGQSFCEQTISVNPVYQVIKLALIAECAKIESYVGRTQEYNQTHHGELIFDTSSKLYRFDIQFETCGVSLVTLRFIVPHQQPLCLYGMHLVLEKNSNPLGMYASDSTLNRAMIECRLDDTKLSEKAAKCRAFVLASMGRQSRSGMSKQIQNIFNNNTSPIPSNCSSTSSSGAISDASGLSSISGVPFDPNGPEDTSNAHPPVGPDPAMGASSFSEMLAKRYIDSKFLELERTIDFKLQAMEVRQNQRLDKIMSLLECISKK